VFTGEHARGFSLAAAHAMIPLERLQRSLVSFSEYLDMSSAAIAAWRAQRISDALASYHVRSAGDQTKCASHPSGCR
jgi:hypothetical protein